MKNKFDKMNLIRFDQFGILESARKMTFIGAAQFILKQNNNKPMTSSEIWREITNQGLVQSKGKTPFSTLTALIGRHCLDTETKWKGRPIFKIVDPFPRKVVLIDPDQEIQNLPDDEDQAELEIRKISKTNPFQQAICVIGESGAGKSVTVENVLENDGHDYEFIIPTATTTGLLVQYSPKKGYVLSRLGKMIQEAAENPNKFYTAVFDEMHKSNVIEMINDELLQCISTKRNMGERFISLDQDTSDLFQPPLEKEHGNIMIPDNFGFIFISSKPNVIMNNPDFFNRVDIVRLTKENRNITTAAQLKSLVLDKDAKSKIASVRND